MQDPFNFYSTRQAAEKLGVSVKRINQLVHGAWKNQVLILPGNKRASSHLIPKSVVDKYKPSPRHQMNAKGTGKKTK